MPVDGIPAPPEAASRTCSSPPERTDVIARIQAGADRNIARFGLLPDDLSAERRGALPPQEREDDAKPFAITLDVGSSRANHTGAWRTERPVYVNNLPPCNNACPAGENIQQWLYDAEEGGPRCTRRPGGRSCEDNPFPAVMGRVCYRPCETACNRAQLDSAVGINSVERFLGDEALRRGWKLPRRGADGASGCWS